MQVAKLEDLIGLTLTAVEDTGKQITFTAADGRRWALYHDQDCCECVRVEDVAGDLNDLVGSPILMAEEVTNAEEPSDYRYGDDSHTWTFYKFATAKGYVTVRWLGESNGYYSEGVSFGRIG